MIDNLEKPTPVEAALGSNMNKGTARLMGGVVVFIAVLGTVVWWGFG